MGFFFDPIAQTDAKAGSVARIVLSSCWSCWSRTSPAFGVAADNSPWPRRFWNPSDGGLGARWPLGFDQGTHKQQCHSEGQTTGPQTSNLPWADEWKKSKYNIVSNIGWFPNKFGVVPSPTNKSKTTTQESSSSSTLIPPPPPKKNGWSAPLPETVSDQLLILFRSKKKKHHQKRKKPKESHRLIADTPNNAIAIEDVRLKGGELFKPRRRRFDWRVERWSHWGKPAFRHGPNHVDVTRNAFLKVTWTLNQPLVFRS